jgi:hypothetical protein
METEKNNPKTEPEQKTTQANKQSTGGEADEPASPPVVQPLNAEGGEPKPAESYDETDRKQDETLQSIAKQTESEAKQAEALEKQTRLMQKQTAWMRRQAIWTAALTILTLGVLVYHGMMMRGQLAQMESSSNDTRQMIGAAQKQAEAAAKQAEVSQSVAEQNKELVTHAGEQAAASQTQADASVAQAGVAKQSLRAAEASAKAVAQSVQASREATHIGNRAYVDIDDVTVNISGDKRQITVFLTLANDGNSSARVDGVVRIHIAPTVSTDCDHNVPTNLQNLVIAPKGKRVTQFTVDLPPGFSIEPNTPNHKYLMYCGRVFYETLGITYPLELCGYYSPIINRFADCEGSKERPY